MQNQHWYITQKIMLSQFFQGSQAVLQRGFILFYFILFYFILFLLTTKLVPSRDKKRPKSYLLPFIQVKIQL
jgi:uncharacterized membrane protein